MYFNIFIGVLFLLAILLNSFIEGTKLKFMYWLIVILLFVSIFNIHLTTKYYIKLRNDPGIRGERGNPGVRGDNGSKGVCVIDNAVFVGAPEDEGNTDRSNDGSVGVFDR